ncbi:MAG: phosphatase PAP2 family protein [Lachnospiraceae bacterium]|nr:phosphatase PAP2 family protein [Lachnospiraceae bacterium]
MDIRYLLFLQELRNGIHDAWTPFMEWISHFAVVYLICIPAVIYWCMDKKKGFYILASVLTARMVNAVIKLTACVYRPWIRDSRVIPVGGALREATGYSFPSGHTVTATPIYGGIAATYGKKRKVIAVICVMLLFVTGFSRNYLGVHTPQDVIFAMLIGGFILLGMSKMLVFLEKHPEKEDLFLLAGCMITIVALVYITVKPYPTDYVDGVLLVNPRKMMQDGYRDICALGAFCVARYIEKHFVKFQATGFRAKGVALAGVGSMLILLISRRLPGPLDEALGAPWGKVIARMLMIFFIVTIWPAVIKWCNKRSVAG